MLAFRAEFRDRLRQSLLASLERLPVRAGLIEVRGLLLKLFQPFRRLGGAGRSEQRRSKRHKSQRQEQKRSA